MEAFSQFLRSVVAYIAPFATLLAVLVIMAYIARQAWEQFVSQPVVEGILAGLAAKSPWLAWLKYAKQAQPYLIGLATVILALTLHIDVTEILGKVVPITLVDDQTRQIVTGLLWAVSAFSVHQALPSTSKNASNQTGGSSGVTLSPFGITELSNVTQSGPPAGEIG